MKNRPNEIDGEILNKFLTHITNIEKLPGMFAVNHVEDLAMVIMGYQFAETSINKTANVSDYMYEFQLYINKWVDLDTESSWVKWIRFYSGSDRHSLELFSDKFRSFQEEWSKISK